MDEKILRLEAKDITKSFYIDVLRNESALQGFIRIFNKKTEKKKLEVINNLSFLAHSNEVIGIIGKNGSGKSTLLRILAEVYKPDSGYVKTNGRVVYMAGFGQGLNPKLSMRENIFLMGSVLGLSQKAIRKKFDEIVKFSELNDFVDTPVYKFSNGMIVRLGFSVTIHCLNHNYPEIMLLDEVLEAGGDMGFIKKAMDKMEGLMKAGALVIMVSHNMENIRNYCDRVILIDGGEIIMDGKPREVVEKYINIF